MPVSLPTPHPVTARLLIRFQMSSRRRFRPSPIRTSYAGGELASNAEKVEPGFPECIAGNGDPAKIPFAGGSSGRRGALADWIASPDNPVTARVMVYRIWQHHFGEGIVGTPSDFGMNGERPTNPPLLDWLATQFVAKKWSIKAMHKIMLLSNTYQQSTADPLPERYVRWQRLEAEVVRDSFSPSAVACRSPMAVRAYS